MAPAGGVKVYVYVKMPPTSLPPERMASTAVVPMNSQELGVVSEARLYWMP